MGKPNLTAEQRAMALRLKAKGLNFKEIGEEIDSSLQTAWNVADEGSDPGGQARFLVARTRTADDGGA